MYKRTGWKQKLSPTLLQMTASHQPEMMCRVIIEIDRQGIESVANLVNASQGVVKRHIKKIPSLAVEIPFSALEELAGSRRVKRIWHDARVRAMLDLAAPTVGGNYAWEQGITGKNTVAAVIDTGISPHPDLVTPENRIVGWVDLLNQIDSPYDDNGHGTHVAGIIAGNGYSSRGRYRGIAPDAKLVGVKALDNGGAGNVSDVIAGIEWVIDNRSIYNIHAINLSLGATAQDSYREDPLCRAVGAAWLEGLVVCAAAGNDGPDPRSINTPGIHPVIITVGNLDDRRTSDSEDNQVNESSSRGPTIDGRRKPDIITPGTAITSLRPRRGYRRLTGTSMSTAVATGGALQILQKWPAFKPDQVKAKMIENAQSMDLDSNIQGYGVLNMERIFGEPRGNNARQEEVSDMTDAKSFFGDNWWIIILLFFLFLIWGGF